MFLAHNTTNRVLAKDKGGKRLLETLVELKIWGMLCPLLLVVAEGSGDVWGGGRLRTMRRVGEKCGWLPDAARIAKGAVKGCRRGRTVQAGRKMPKAV